MEKIYPISQELASFQPSEIQHYFAASTVFVTGATGFLGRLLVEKLLRSCRDIEKIYILMRPKKGKTVENRFAEYFEDVLFSVLIKENPKGILKVSIVIGDCALPDLGLSAEDKAVLAAEVDCVFHVAATVRFDEKLRKAAHINVRATRDLLRMSRSFKNLTSFVYVSTAYSHCVEKNIDEAFYEPALTGSQLLAIADNLSEEKLDELAPALIGRWPNTYVFTKAVAEDVVRKEGADLPVAVIRPSIVIAAAFEPIPGWIDNFYGATGVFAGTGAGLIRTMHCKPDNLADLMPADYVINNMIAVAWDVANSKRSRETKDPIIPIYNCVSSPQQPYTWRQSMNKGFEYGKIYPPYVQIWHHCLFLNSSKLVHLLLHYLIHIVPAYVVDFLAYLTGREVMLVKSYVKITKFLEVVAFFTTHEWTFSNDNTQKLWKKLNLEDRKTFRFDMADLDWHSYYRTYVLGLREYVLKDPLDTIPKGLAKAKKLKIAHYLLVTVVFVIALRLLLFVLQCVL